MDITKHPLLEKAYEVCIAVEKCGASEEVTEASIKANELMECIDIDLCRVNGLTFGMATEAAKKGFKVAREGWNGAGMFAYIVPAANYHAQTEIARDHFGDGRGKPNVPYRAYWALKTAQDDIATWAPSGSDSLADDWMIVE